LLESRAEQTLSGFFKKVLFWNYARNTWQWDLLCVLILIFIFLTPKSWFTNGERLGTEAHQKPVSTIMVDAEVIDNIRDRYEIQQRVRVLSGRPEVEIVNIRKSFDEKGKARGYEVDIR
jgi:hypothetical protein